ncbi:MAG: LysM peptidoglycan-binding domain-containing protein, partial [Spirochaetaceae bacterium]|nr:LysM peptidoglycan-binding domain-containing protein [Spirochaetaceae bacterium]
EDLEKAKSLKKSDPYQSRNLLETSIKKANEAYENSIDSQVKAKVAKLRALESNLMDIEAERFSPGEFKIVKDRADQLIIYLNNKDYTNADKQYNSTLRAMQNLYDTLDNNIRWVKILDRDTKAYMIDAEEKEAFLWAPEELEKSNYLYSEGIAHFNNYNLKSSEQSLKEAKYWAFHSIRLSKERKRQNQTEILMLEALEKLKKASQNKVLDADGNIIEANPWEGDDFLIENPALKTEAEDFSEDDSSLKDYDPDAEINNDNNSSFLINGTTSVLGDEQKMSLLDQAIELWKQGVKARAEGKYDIADEYFKQSNAYAEAYNANAIANEYIVKKHDTLWAISAKKEILNNPFLWTKIWRRNNQLIENPDLIYPGQKLIIPPK